LLLLPAAPSGPAPAPAEQRAAVAEVVANTTACSTTCGLGVWLEEVCGVSANGKRGSCRLRRSRCLSGWSCGIAHLTVGEGEPLQLRCLPPDVASFSSRAYRCSWRFAPGFITTNDALFRPLGRPEPVLALSAASESDAGTYRCDVRLLKMLKVVQRSYFGVTVIRKDLVHLSFANGTRGAAQGWPRWWQWELLRVCAAGAGAGALGGALVIVALRCLKVRGR
ncbi:TMM81 protein, partial [Rhinopomastus cyanomelas]|nr:TMM81 protein [Rhinopomastus cyanomelas]